jgi:hypothetical protein
MPACFIRVSWRFLGLAKDFVNWLISMRCRWRMMLRVMWPDYRGRRRWQWADK